MLKCLFLLCTLLGIPAQSAPVTLPDWAKPMESALPNIPAEMNSEVNDLCALMDAWCDGGDPSIREQRSTAVRRLEALGEQAKYAMIYQYLKALDRGTSYVLASSGVAALRNDRNLAAWVLPLLRHKIELLKQAVQNPTNKISLEASSTLGGLPEIELYLMKQGEFSDLENFNLVTDGLIKLGIFRAGYDTSSQKRLPDQVKSMQRAREEAEKNYKPSTAAQPLRIDGQRKLPLGPRKPLPDIKRFAPILQPWMVWPMWVCIGILSAWLLRWVILKKTSYKDDGGDTNYLA